MKKIFCTLLLLVLGIATKATAQMVPFSYMRIHEVVSNLRTVSSLSGRDVTAARPNAGCSSGGTVLLTFQAIRVSSTGMYSILSTQTADGYLILLKDYADVSNLLTSCVMANDDYNGTTHSYLSAMLDANHDYYIVSANYSGTSTITYNTQIVGPGVVTETSPNLTNSAASMAGAEGGYIYLTGSAKADTTAIGVYNDRYCVNKVNSGAEDLATFTSTGLKTLLGNGLNTFYGRLTDATGVRACTPIGQACASPIPVTPTNLSPLSLTTGVFHTSPTFTWDPLGAVTCGSTTFEYSVGTTSGGTDLVGWSSTGNSRIISTFFIPGKYYFNIRMKSSSSAVSSVVTTDWTVAPSVSFSGAIYGASPTFVRPAAGTPPTASTFTTRYEVRSFTVGTSGTYNIGTYFGWDGFLVLYKDSFDPAQPLLNAITANDDYNNSIYSFVSANLTAGVTYFIVNTQYNSATGSYTTYIDGPGVVTLNP